jgi:ribosomal protein S18 acetylase RimI-like enzyme
LSGVAQEEEASRAARAIMAYVRAVASPRSEHLRCGPFSVKISTATASPHFNYALPDDGAEPSPADISELSALFHRRGRAVRLEFVPAAAPHLGARLEAAGMRLTEELPLMVCTPDAFVALPVPQGIRLAVPRSDTEFRAMAALQHAAFGEPAPGAELDVAARRGSQQAGGLLLTAVSETLGPGGVVGAGMAAPAHAGVREIIGVAVDAGWRRQGIAGAIVAELTRQAFAEGCRQVFLEAAPGAGGAYSRAGFRTTASVAHYAG